MLLLLINPRRSHNLFKYWHFHSQIRYTRWYGLPMSLIIWTMYRWFASNYGFQTGQAHWILSFHLFLKSYLKCFGSKRKASKTSLPTTNFHKKVREDFNFKEEIMAGNSFFWLYVFDNLFLIPKKSFFTEFIL